MDYESYLKSSLAKYQNADFTKNEVLRVIAVFDDLRPKLEKTELEEGKKTLLQLAGCLPVHYKGKTYNTPVCVLIFDNYPYRDPAVYVTPTSSMYIRQYQNVDLEGKVSTEYLKKWQYPNSDLMSLLLDLVEVFRHNPPLSIKPSQDEYIEKLNLENYMDPVNSRKDAIGIMNVYPDLRPNLKEHPSADGMRKQVLSVEGTVPVIFTGNIYSIPICIHLMEQHPYQAPEVYVNPTTGMKINVCRYVDKTGQITCPYLSDWSYPATDLLSLLQDLTVVFGKTPPLYRISETEQKQWSPITDTIPGHAESTSNKQLHCGGNVSESSCQADTANIDSGQVPGRAAPYNEHCLDSTEDFDIHCDPCHAESSFVEAEGFCVDCKEYYCKACLKYHHKISATRHHAILLKDKMPKP